MASETKIITARVGRYAPLDFHAYQQQGGLAGLRRALAMKPEEVIETVKLSGLTGRGGAGFPTGQKWFFAARQSRRPRYLICNADEGELGTFKDRVLLEGDPWAVLEGMLIAAYAIGAEKMYIYIRGEYRQAFTLWEQLAQLGRAEGMLDARILGQAMAADLQVVRGRGLYIAGEELALIASLGAQRPVSGPKPPYPAESGLLGQPTVVHNVETLANVPVILAQGAAEYRRIGAPEEPGTRLYSLSGDIARPGVYELPVGAMTIGELIDGLGGGMAPGNPFKAVQPGGGTSAFLGPAGLGCRLASVDLRQAGSSLGTAGVIVYGQKQDAAQIAGQLLDYYGKESCGRCAPCRISTLQMRAIIRRLLAGAAKAEDLVRLREAGEACLQTSTCGMGQAFPLPVLSALKLFPEDFQSYLKKASEPSNADG